MPSSDRYVVLNYNFTKQIFGSTIAQALINVFCTMLKSNDTTCLLAPESFMRAQHPDLTKGLSPDNAKTAQPWLLPGGNLAQYKILESIPENVSTGVIVCQFIRSKQPEITKNNVVIVSISKSDPTAIATSFIPAPGELAFQLVNILNFLGIALEANIPVAQQEQHYAKASALLVNAESQYKKQFDVVPAMGPAPKPSTYILFINRILERTKAHPISSTIHRELNSIISALQNKSLSAKVNTLHRILLICLAKRSIIKKTDFLVVTWHRIRKSSHVSMYTAVIAGLLNDVRHLSIKEDLNLQKISPIYPRHVENIISTIEGPQDARGQQSELSLGILALESDATFSE